MMSRELWKNHLDVSYFFLYGFLPSVNFTFDDPDFVLK